MKIKNEKYFAGIDSGGTKCEIYVRTESNKTLNQKFPSVHYSLNGPDEVAKNISDNLKFLLKKNSLSLKNCCGIVIGIAGAREKKDKLNLKKSLSAKLNFKNIAVETDANIALHGAFDDNDGIVLICGTGSVLYGVHDGVLLRIGGWGKILGDQGSGFWIGKEALRRFADEIDLRNIRKEPSLLYRMIGEKMNLNKSNLVNKSFKKNFPFQNIAPIVLECASAKDLTSLEILETAARDLIDHLRKFFKVSGRRKSITLVFTGSLIENDNIYSDMVKTKIKKIFNNRIKLTKPLGSPSYGGYLLAKKYFG